MFVGEMLSSHDWRAASSMVMLVKRSLRLGSSHGFETNEQLCNDRLSSEGRWLKISSSDSWGRPMLMVNAVGVDRGMGFPHFPLKWWGPCRTRNYIILTPEVDLGFCRDWLCPQRMGFSSRVVSIHKVCTEIERKRYPSLHDKYTYEQKDGEELNA